MGRTVQGSMVEIIKCSADRGWIFSVLVIHTEKANEAIGGNKPQVETGVGIEREKQREGARNWRLTSKSGGGAR